MNYSQLLAAANEAALYARHLPWEAIAVAAANSPLLASVKHWLQIEGSKHYKFLFIRFTGEQVMLALVTVLPLAETALNYLVHTPTHDPSIILIQTAVLGFMMQPVYYLGVKPGIALLKKQVEKAAQYNLDGLANARAYQSSTTN